MIPEGLRMPSRYPYHCVDASRVAGYGTSFVYLSPRNIFRTK